MCAVAVDQMHKLLETISEAGSRAVPKPADKSKRDARDIPPPPVPPKKRTSSLTRKSGERSESPTFIPEECPKDWDPVFKGLTVDISPTGDPGSDADPLVIEDVVLDDLFAGRMQSFQGFYGVRPTDGMSEKGTY